MDTTTVPHWLEELRRREAEGELALRPRLVREWEKHAGVTKDMAAQILDGVPAHSEFIDSIAKWVLDMPDAECRRQCEACGWSGKEKDCALSKDCPQCGQGTYPAPPVI